MNDCPVQLQMKLGEVGTEYFQSKFGVDVLDEFQDALHRLESQGWLSVADQKIQLSRKGLLRVDTLLPEFYDQPHRGARYT